MRFDDYTYLWPPRPTEAISPQMLSMIERRGYHAQIKKNGTCNVLAVSPSKDIIAKNRHQQDHSLWRPDSQKLKAFTSLPGEGWYVFVTEVLHSKIKDGPRDTNYVHDILVADGEYLVGMTQGNRHALLCELFGVEVLQETYSHWVVDPNTWIARQFTQGFSALYSSLTDVQDEGLVLKNPNTPLQLCVREASNNAGMLKSRKGHKNYTF